MKKTILNILALVAFATGYAQQDQFELMSQPDLKMIHYKIFTSGEVSTYMTYTTEIVKNKFDKPYSFSKNYATDGKRDISDFTPNHYTKPSFFYNESLLNPGIPKVKTSFYLIVDGVFYRLTGMFDQIKPGGDYHIDKDELHYILGSVKQKETTSNETGKKKKLGGLKAKLVSKLNLNPIPAEIKNRDHRAVIDAYLSKMEKIQADIKYTAEEQKELDEIREDKIEKSGKANAANAEFEERMNSTMTLKNKSGHDIYVRSYHYNVQTKEIYEATYSLSSGSDMNIYCKENAYITKVDGNDVADKLVYTKNTSCRGEHVIQFIP